VISTYLEQVSAVTEVEVRKLWHDPMELLTRAVQPMLWLLIFGQVFAHLRQVPTGGLAYLDFMAPGILAQSSLFVSIFFGMAIIWERDLGVLHKYLVSPAARSALVLGKALAAGFRSVAQAIIVYAIALLLGIHMRFTPGPVLGVVLFLMLGSALFATFSMIIACIVKSRERFMGIGQVMTMPLFFASNAIYPLAMMPHWLRVISRFNPLSYQVDALRTLMIQGGESVFGLWADLGVLTLLSVILIAIGARLYPTVVQ
jgi:ABC-2 type transport system permease protein